MNRISDVVWELPQQGGMNAPGRVFASEELIVKAQSDKAVDQVANVAHLPGIVGASFAMPDIHWGYGFPIGGVAATDIDAGGVVSPGGVGFDISCGVRLVRSDVVVTDAREHLEELVRALEMIPRGVGGDGMMPLTIAEMDGVLARGVPFVLDRGSGWAEDVDLTEDPLDPEDDAQAVLKEK
jgi:tRNA-splicing ligase RtcB